MIQKNAGVIHANSDLPIYWRGPEIDQGKLPAFFYFALSGSESLHQDPYNQPIVFLKDFPIRCYSFTLPFHGPGHDNQRAIELWSQELMQNPTFLEIFFQKCLTNVFYLIQEGLVDENHMAIGGLSRGGFIATHLAARERRFKYILGFAPMTSLTSVGENKPLEHPWNLLPLVNQLAHQCIRFYIGNRDLRVNTRACFEFIQHLTEAAYLQGHRSPPVELMISPSVGFKGHGTLPPVFKDGVEWLAAKLCS